MLVLLLLISVCVLHVKSSAPPPCPGTMAVTLCILGADDAGVGAAFAAQRLNMTAILSSWNERDMGGDLASGVRTDLGTEARNAGGLSLAYDRFARRSSDTPCGTGARISPPGPSFSFLRGLLANGSSSVTYLPGWIPVPGGGLVDAQNRVSGVTMVAENGSTCLLTCRYAIEGTSEGYALRAFNQSIRFGREGYRNASTTPPCSDVTNCAESLAGRRIYGAAQPFVENCNASATCLGLAPMWPNVSDTSEEGEDVSSAASAILTLRQYAPYGSPVPDDAPWLLATPPEGYEEGSFWFLNVTSPFSGDMGGGVARAEFEHSYGLPLWYEVPPGGGGAPVHYLRIPGNPWPPKRAVDAKNFWYATGSLYAWQRNNPVGRYWGLDNASYPLPAHPACINTSAFGSAAYGGAAYEQLSCRLYRRVVSRLASPSGAAVGGQAMLPRPLFQKDPPWLGRTFWEPEALGVPLYPVDYRGVLSDSLPLPAWAGPEGFVSLVYGNMGGLDAHGLHRRLLVPEPSSSSSGGGGGGGGDILNLLSPGAPRSTFQAQAALRIHATASNLGLASVALIQATEAMGNGGGSGSAGSTNDTPTALAQYIMASPRLGGVLWLSDAAFAGSPSFLAAALPGVYGVPPAQLSPQYAPALPSRAEATLWMAMYANGLLLGSIPRWPAPPTIPPPPPLPPGISLPWNATDQGHLTRGDLAAMLDALVPNSSAAALSHPINGPSLPAMLCDIRQVLTRHILFVKTPSAWEKGALSLPPYVFPDYVLADSFAAASGAPNPYPEWPSRGGSSPTTTCNTSGGFAIQSGVLARDPSAPPDSILMRVCNVSSAMMAEKMVARVPLGGAFPSPFLLSIDFYLQQTVVPLGSPSLTNAGLYYLFASQDTTSHGWFGLLSDEGAAGSDGPAGAGFDSSQTLLWGLRLPGGELLTQSVPWSDGDFPIFFLQVEHDGKGNITASVNGDSILRGSFADAAGEGFGVRAGEGAGRGIFGNLLLSTSSSSDAAAAAATSTFIN